MFIYKPFSDRQPDTQYHDLLARIMDKGTVVKENQQGEETRRILGHQWRFDLTNGFPVITERNIAHHLPGAFGEILAFINGVRTLEGLESFGCKWWDRWATPKKCEKRGLVPGDLGNGSYGAAFHDFPTAEGDPFNQVKHMVEQIKELPQLRTHFLSPWIPQYIGRGKGKQQKVVVAPCHGWCHVLVTDGVLSLHHYQRSGDVPVGVVYNLAQYALLTLLLAQVTGNEVGEYVYTLSDAHIYESQYPYVEQLLKNGPGVFPELLINPKIDDIFEFRPKDLVLKDYYPTGPAMDIPTPV